MARQGLKVERYTYGARQRLKVEHYSYGAPRFEGRTVLMLRAELEGRAILVWRAFHTKAGVMVFLIKNNLSGKPACRAKLFCET